MKRATVLAALHFVTTLISGCASVTKSTVPFHEEVFRGDGDDAIVYIYRMKSFIGAIAAWRVKLDDKVVATLRQNAYIALHVTPGAHTLLIGDSSPAVVLGGAAGAVARYLEASGSDVGAFTINSKETYFVRCEGNRVEFVTREKAMDELKLMHFDMGR